MSLINRMLQDLDRRQALDTADAGVVRASAAKPASREWFWRVLVVLLTIALAWMGWVAIQLLPRKPLATDLAFLAASEARARTPVTPITPVTPPAPPVIETAAPVPAPEQPAPVVPAMPSIDALRLATELQTPIVERRPPEPAKPMAAAPAKPKATAPHAQAGSDGECRQARPRCVRPTTTRRRFSAGRRCSSTTAGSAKPKSSSSPPCRPTRAMRRLAKPMSRCSSSSGASRRRAACCRRRSSSSPRSRPSPWRWRASTPPSATTPRPSPSSTVQRPIGEGSADFQAFRGAMLQRLGRHEEALVAYQNAVREGTPPATAWIGYAISLEAVGKRSEAAQAYRRALTVGPIAAEAREYAESRARALE